MILNENLKKILSKTKEQNDDAYNEIINFLNSIPKNVTQNFTSLGIESVGSYNNEFGFWHICANLDSFGKVESLKVKFEGERSSKKPYYQSTLLHITQPTTEGLKATKKENLVFFTTTRTPNYRFASNTQSPLTIYDIKKISQPTTINSFKLDLAVNKVTKKLQVIATQKAGQNGFAYDTEDASDLAVFA